MQHWAKLVPELLVSDLQASLRFWVDLLGFQVAYERAEEGFAYLDRDGAQIMLERRDPASRQWLTGTLDQPYGRGINFQIEVASVASILCRLEDAGWPLFLECETKCYRVGETAIQQRQFLVQDPDGYLVRLAETIDVRSLDR